MAPDVGKWKFYQPHKINSKLVFIKLHYWVTLGVRIIFVSTKTGGATKRGKEQPQMRISTYPLHAHKLTGLCFTLYRVSSAPASSEHKHIGKKKNYMENCQCLFDCNTRNISFKSDEGANLFVKKKGVSFFANVLKSLKWSAKQISINHQLHTYI